MKKGWKLLVWGTRGSFPQASKEYLEYGGNTSCISVECEDRILVFDAGSGLANLGKSLKDRSVCPRIDLFLSHVHMDHVIGFCNFQPFFDESAQIHVYGEEKEGISPKEQIRRIIGPPYWPVGLEDFHASVSFHTIKAGETISLTDHMAVRTLRGHHPNESILYRLELEGKSMVYGLDCEMDDAMLEQLAQFAAGCDLLICDAQYTQEELGRRNGWGHGSWQQGALLRKKAEAGQALMTHYSWDYTDVQVRRQEEEAALQDPACLFAREGMEIQL